MACLRHKNKQNSFPQGAQVFYRKDKTCPHIKIVKAAADKFHKTHADKLLGRRKAKEITGHKKVIE